MATRDIYSSGFDESTGKSVNAEACPECDGTLRTDGGEIACTECGLIVNEYFLDHSTSARDFPDDRTSVEHTGAPLMEGRHDRGLSSEIGQHRDARGNALSARKRRQLRRLRREHSRAKWRTTAERNLGDACTEIARVTSMLDLALSTREEASRLYREAMDAELVQGRSVESIATACVYAACRRAGQTRTLAEIATVARCPESALRRAYNVLNTNLAVAARPPVPAASVPQICSALDAPARVRHLAYELADAASETGIGIGSNPASVAAGCVAVVVDECECDYTQRAIADAAGITPATVRSKRDDIRAGGCLTRVVAREEGDE